MRSEREKLYVAAYLGAAKGVGVVAARMAGYRDTENNLKTQSARLRKLPHVAAAIEAGLADQAATLAALPIPEGRVIRRSERARRKQAAIPRQRIARAWGKAETECWLCGKADRPLERVHIVPHSHGGGVEAGNLALMCRPCHEWQERYTAVFLKVCGPERLAELRDSDSYFDVLAVARAGA